MKRKIEKRDRTCDTCKYFYKNCYGEDMCDHPECNFTDVNLLIDNCILYEEEE